MLRSVRSSITSVPFGIHPMAGRVSLRQVSLPLCRPSEGAVPQPRLQLLDQANNVPAGFRPYPGNLQLDWDIERAMRFNAALALWAAKKTDGSLGGHATTPAALATWLNVGLLHVFGNNDITYCQGHASPALYAWHLQSGAVSPAEFLRFRRLGKLDGKPEGEAGMTSYFHPLQDPRWLNATVSMGLGPLAASQEAKFGRQLEALGEVPESHRVWAFIGDGETGEPEVFGTMADAARYKLGRLCYVFSVNHQSLDGPPDGGNNSMARKIEAHATAAGWNIVKNLWGRKWDAVFAEEAAAGERTILDWLNQVNDGTLLNSYNCPPEDAKSRLIAAGLPPRLAAMPADALQELFLDRGGHDPVKVYEAYQAALACTDRPTAIISHTTKGMWIPGVEGRYGNHSKKIEWKELSAMAQALEIDLPAEEPEPSEALIARLSGEARDYLMANRHALGGIVRTYAAPKAAPTLPPLADVRATLARAAAKDTSTTALINAYVRSLFPAQFGGNTVGDAIVPVLADEARTFGMDGFFPKLGVFDLDGMQYTNAEQGAMHVDFRPDGRMVQQGINEAAAVAFFTAAGRAYRTYGIHKIPIFTYYAHFGGRVFDSFWQAGDMRAGGILVGATAGQTTLNGEGAQHAAATAAMLAGLNPAIGPRVYDFAYADALAIGLHAAINRILHIQPNALYKLLAYNEKWSHQGHTVPHGWEEGVVRGGYPLEHWRDRDAGYYFDPEMKPYRATIWASGSTLPLALEAQRILLEDFGGQFNVLANVMDITSYHAIYTDWLLYRRALRLGAATARAVPAPPFVNNLIFRSPDANRDERDLPIVAVVDGSPQWAGLAAQAVHDASDGRSRYEVLGTSGFGRNDTRANLRDFFEIGPRYIAHAVLHQLGLLTPEIVRKLGIDPEKPWPGDTDRGHNDGPIILGA